jgi:hypothetical protein
MVLIFKVFFAAFALTLAAVSCCASQSSGSEGQTEHSKSPVKICVPEFENVSTRSVNLEWLREGLIKSLNKKKLVAVPSQGHAGTPDYADGRALHCNYVLRVEITELFLKSTSDRGGITFGSRPHPDVSEPESLNKRYAARLDYGLVETSGEQEKLASVANGESDSELQAVSSAESTIVNRVLAELEKHK